MFWESRNFPSGREIHVNHDPGSLVKLGIREEGSFSSGKKKSQEEE